MKQAYWDSLTPIAAYPCGAPHALPEVICFTPIPKDRIRFVEAIERDELINRVRECGGWPPHPARPRFEVDEATFLRHLGLSPDTG